uniref:U4/U6.U5 tri-snRNP-associated protein 1 n=1 Tax=Hemiselmis andersenii TaxID=464988 RepID=A0A7S0XVM7_HEMAN
MAEEETEKQKVVGQVFEKEAMASGSVSEALRIIREKGMKEVKLAGRQGDAKHADQPSDKVTHWADNEFDKKFTGQRGEKKEIEIQRLDEFGRPMTTKEAWRHLNHAFHGKAPGVKQQVKRKKQYLEEMKVKKTNAGEHAVQQMEKLHNVQAKGGNVSIVLSGSNSVAAHAIQAEAHQYKKEQKHGK